MVKTMTQKKCPGDGWKKKKDPNHPKRGLSSYMFYTKANRAAIAKEIPGKYDISAVGKKLGAGWKALGEGEKVKYQALATADKQRYQKELEGYDKPEFPTWEKKKKKKAAKKKKDPNAPKRGLSAYMFFVKAIRPSVMKKNPGIAFGDVGKKIGAQWKLLDADAKAPFAAKAVTDKARYAREKAAYDAKAVKAEEAEEEEEEEEDEEEDSESADDSDSE